MCTDRLVVPVFGGGVQQGAPLFLPLLPAAEQPNWLYSVGIAAAAGTRVT